MLYRYIVSFLRYVGTKIFLLVGLLLLTGLTEGIGLLMLVPFIQLIGLGGDAHTSSGIVKIIAEGFAVLGLPLTLPVVLAVFLTLMAFRALLLRGREVILSEVRLTFVDALRIELHRTICAADWQFLSERRSSNIHHVLTTDIDRVGQGTFFLLSFIVTAMMASIYTVTAFSLSPIVTLAALTISASLMVVLLPFIRRAQQLGRQLTEAQRDVYGTVSQFLDGIKLAKSYGAEAHHHRAFTASVIYLREQLMGFTRSYSNARLLYQLGGAIGLCCLLYFATVIVKLPAPELLVLVLIFSRLLPMLSQLQQSFQHIAYMLPAFDAAMQLQTHCQAAAEPLPAASDDWRPTLHRQLRLDGIAFQYGTQADKAALSEINLTIPAHQTTAVIGASGAGKSTLADLLLGLLQPSAGRLTIDDEALSPQRLKRWREAIAYVPQETFLFHQSIRANLLWAKPDASEAELWHTLRLVAAERFVSELRHGLDTVVGDRGLRLSGGERQRLALARALLRKPTLLILDEATSALDTEHERRIQQAIESMHGELTIVLIAHRLSTVRRADQVVVLEAGRIVEQGSWLDLAALPDGRLNQLLAAGQTELSTPMHPALASSPPSD